MDERERACDEDVVRLGANPREYATGILNTCRHAVESPLVCVSAVSGGDLKKRIARIVANAGTEPLTASRKAMLLMMAAMAIAGPIAAGVMHPVRVQAQSSGGEMPTHVSITPNTSGGPMTLHALIDKPWGWSALYGGPRHGHFTVSNISARGLIRLANSLEPFQIVGPSWIKSEGFNIVIDAESDPFQDEHSAILRDLLADRFKLQAHREVRDLTRRDHRDDTDQRYAIRLKRGGPLTLALDLLRQQLGLAPTAPKGAMEVLVIDHIERPVFDAP
jgi:bla regulator protein blaR1